MSRASLVRSFAFVIILTIGPTAAHAQSIGTFRWQLQPYCNVVTLSITQAGAVYTLDGYDDQCGAATRAPVTGSAVPNPDGTIEIGFGIVASPDARPVHVAVAINTATLGGTWTDSAGHSGTFAFTPIGGTGGAPRPAATGNIGAAEVNPEQVQLRVSGACPSGQAIGEIEQNGTVSCAPTGSGDITEVVTQPGSGLTGGATDGVASLGLARTTSGAFDLSNAYGVGTNQNSYSTYAGNTPWTGFGKRMFWHTPKAAFRAGLVDGNHWDDSNIGGASVAFGWNTTASGFSSLAAGAFITASGQSAVALGTNLNAAGGWSVVLGTLAGTTAAGEGSFVYGDRTLGPVFQSTAPNQFLVRASGGTTFYSNYVLSSGVRLAPNASAWSSLSDVNSKEHFRDLDGEDVLAKIAWMPIREWNYKAQDAAIRHVGPTAQDFHAAFGLGEDPLRISTIDADGIALAAVQALEARTRGADETLARENQELRKRIEALERLIQRQ
jgi:Chaperone of endosialidase